MSSETSHSKPSSPNREKPSCRPPSPAYFRGTPVRSHPKCPPSNPGKSGNTTPRLPGNRQARATPAARRSRSPQRPGGIRTNPLSGPLSRQACGDLAFEANSPNREKTFLPFPFPGMLSENSHSKLIPPTEKKLSCRPPFPACFRGTPVRSHPKCPLFAPGKRKGLQYYIVIPSLYGGSPTKPTPRTERSAARKPARLLPACDSPFRYAPPAWGARHRNPGHSGPGSYTASTATAYRRR